MKHHHGIRPEGRPIELRVRVSKASGRGVQVRLVDGHDRELFWLPAGWPAEWLAVPEIGEVVGVKLPRWLATKHQPIVALRSGFQRSLNFYTPPPLNAEANREGSFPMTDRPEDAGKGFLARNDRREKPSHPEFTGKLSIHGREYRLAAWVREKDGKKFFSIAANEVSQQPPAEPTRPSFDRRNDPASYWGAAMQAREAELLAARESARDVAAGEARGQALVDGVLASVEDAKAFDAAFTTTFDALGAESQAAVRDALRGPTPEATKPATELQLETFAGTGKECASLVKAWGSAARHRFAAASERFDAMLNGMTDADADRAEGWFRALPPAAKAAVVKQLAG
jgi:hypothetical protein